jgi:hypothetical protein
MIHLRSPFVEFSRNERSEKLAWEILGNIVNRVLVAANDAGEKGAGTQNKPRASQGGNAFRNKKATAKTPAPRGRNGGQCHRQGQRKKRQVFIAPHT